MFISKFFSSKPSKKLSGPYYTLKVVEVVRETPDAISIYLEHPSKQPIPYKPGQFLTLILPVNGQKIRRSYSISSSASDAPRIAVTVKRVAGGVVSNYLLNEVKVGQELEVMEPLGNFCLECQAKAERDVILFGAGSGITPLMSIVKTVLHEEPKSKVTLLYGNRNEQEVIFKSQLAQLQATHPQRLHVEYIYSQPQQDAEHRGRMNQSHILKILERRNLARPANALYFMCGPDGMMEEVRHALQVLHVPEERIFKESFVSSKPEEQPATAHGDVSAAAGDSAMQTQTVTIMYEGAEYTVEVPPSKTILEAALDQNIDLPYSCQAGLCTACRGKCLSGKVHLDESDGLSDAELEEGYVLNCVGHPLTDNVVIEIG